MDIRPHRRIAVEIAGDDLMGMINFISDNFEHFGLVIFNTDTLNEHGWFLLDTAKNCGLKTAVRGDFPTTVSSDILDKIDFIITNTLLSQYRSDQQLLTTTDSGDAAGLACGGKDLSNLRDDNPAAVLLVMDEVLSPEKVMKIGVDFFVYNQLLTAKNPVKEARDLADRIRKYT